MNSISLALISIAFGAVGQVLLKFGADKVKSLSFTPETFFIDVWKIMKAPQILTGMFFFAMSSLIWIKVLTQTELSSAYPLVSLSYILVAILSFLLLQEQFTVQKILGIAVIITGVLVLNI